MARAQSVLSITFHHPRHLREPNSDNKGIITANATTNSVQHAVVLLPVSIVPDAGQAGVTGDLVPSIKGGSGERHYVSPKQVSSFVVLKANIPNIDSSNFGTLFYWDTINPDGTPSSAGQGPGYLTDNTRWEVKRDTPGHYIVRIRMINGGAEVARMNVWVVWATLTPTVGAVGVLNNGDKISASDTTSWQAIIQPAGICYNTNDIPNLMGAPVSNVPEYSLQETDIVKATPFQQPENKWDLARAIRVHVESPTVGTSGYYLTHVAGPIYSGLPSASHFPSNSPDVDITGYPINVLEGNDTSFNPSVLNTFTVGKFCNVYVTDSPGNGHDVIDQMSDEDEPNLPQVLNSSGSLDDTIIFNTQWLEFARLEINGKWYIISDRIPSRLNVSLKKTGTGWTDNGSISDASNSDF